METKEINIVAPTGYTIDKENSTFECIKFKKIEQKKWRDSSPMVQGRYLGGYSPQLSSFIEKLQQTLEQK